MSFKVKPPKEDPETKRRREQAQNRAEASRTDATQRDLDKLTEELLRVFGRQSSLGGLAGGAIGGGGAAPGGGGVPGVGGGAVGGGSYDPGYGFLIDPLSEGGYGERFGRLAA